MKNDISNRKNSDSYNNYITFNDSIVFLDPLVIFILKKKKDGFNLNQIIDLPPSSFPCGIKPKKKDIQHYFIKGEFLDHFYQKKNNNIDKFISLNAKDFESKLSNLNQITFEVTDSCNLNCRYCGYGEFYNDYDKRENLKMDVSTAKTILDYLITLWNSNLNLSHKKNVYISFYGGEPLLNMTFIKAIVNYINDKYLMHNYITYSLTTNALLLKKHIDYFVENNFKLLISLDGDSNNNSYRVFKNGRSSFKIVTKNIKYVKEKYPDYFNKMVNFNSVLHNKNSISEIYSYIKKEYGKLPSIAELNNMGIKPEKRKEFYQTYQNENESLMMAEDYTFIKKDMSFKIRETLDLGLFLHQYSGNIFYDYNDLFINKDFILRTPTGTCFPFGKKMFVTVNGKILACEKIGHQFALGKVTHKNVELDFEKVSVKYNRYYSKIKSQCNYCFNLASCIQCIFNLEDIEGSPICKGFLNAEQFNQKVNFEMCILEEDSTMYDKVLQELILEF